MQQARVKVNVKIRGADGKFTWVHFCYVDRKVKRKFERKVNVNSLLHNHWMTYWAGVEFGLFDIETAEGLELLRTEIRDKYRKKYPDIFRDTDFDRQGWVGIWFKENMELELRNLE